MKLNSLSIAQWHQWLRYTRSNPPSVAEQYADVQRLTQLKQLAQLADERWASKPSYLDAPETTSQPAPTTLPKDGGGYVGDNRAEAAAAIGVRGPKAENPWNANRGGPSEKWQPESWKPAPTQNRD